MASWIKPRFALGSKAAWLGLTACYLYLINWLATGQSALWVMAAWLLLFSPIVLLPKALFRLVLSVQLLIAGVAVFVKSRYNVLISEDILLSAMLNENDLTAEMLSWQGIGATLLLAGVPIYWLWRCPIVPLSAREQLKQSALLLVLTSVLLTFSFPFNDYQMRDKGQIRDNRLMNDVFHFSPVDAQYNAHRAYKNLKKLRKNYQNIDDLTQKHQYHSENDDLLVVVILGESTRGDRFSLLGYPKNTNPKLSQITDLYTFLATSCDTLTIHSLHCLASPMRFQDEGRAVKQSSFGQIFRHLGYQTEIYSLQTLGAFYAYLGYDKLLSKYEITAQYQNGAKDSMLLPHVLQAIEHYRGGKRLIIAHTLGSHQTYADRITQATFQPSCASPDVAQCSAESLNHAYDNTVLAVDDFIAQTIKALEPHKALLLYVSDHGESLGEGGHYFHGQPVHLAPKEQFSIPMLFWFSPSYRASETGAKLAERVQQAHQNKALLSHDEVFHSVLGCAGIVSPDGGIDPKLNLCAEP